MQARTLAFPGMIWPLPQSSRRLVRNVLLMVAMYAGITMSTFSIVRSVNAYPSCGAEEHIIQYPKYSANGVVIDHVYHCGKPTRSCTLIQTLRTGTLYECPALNAPL